MDRVLVTGGAGYIGSHVCKALAQSGFEPVTYDNLSTGHREAVKWGPFVQGNIRNPIALSRAFREYNPVAVMHFAAYAYVGESVIDPHKYYLNNVIGSWTLLEEALNADIEKFIFSSSCATYGCPEKLPIREDTPQHPINPYGSTKLIVEQMLRDLSLFPYGILRYFNAAGCDPELFERHNPETHLIPKALLAAQLRETFPIYGNDYPTPDGTCIRDYVHVNDLARAHVDALKTRENVILNLGGGTGYSVKEVINMVRKVTGLPLPTEILGRRPGDPAVLVADISKAKQILNWSPQRDLETLVRSAYFTI